MGEKDTGCWLEEAAGAYYVFKNAGFEVDITSISGGLIPVDPGSLAEGFYTADAKKFKEEDAEAWAKFTTSKPLSTVTIDEYDGIFLAGGHGTCTDFYQNADLAKVVESFFNASKPVAAVCHGPNGLLACKKSDGKPLCEGLNMTCFSDVEEDQVGLTEKVPELIESAFKKQGANFTCGAPWSDHSVVDGKLVTGQNPQSTVSCAKLLVALF